MHKHEHFRPKFWSWFAQTVCSLFCNIYEYIDRYIGSFFKWYVYFIEYICIYYVFIQEQVVHHVVDFQGDTAYELY